jgi:acyl dehydratase
MITPSTGERLPVTTIGPFSLGNVARYATASGDSNPIHFDPAAAVAAGLAGPIVHGMLVMGHMVRIAEAWRAEAVVTMARVVFVRPIGLGKILTVEGRIVARQGVASARQSTLRLTAKDDGGVIAAIVEARMRDAESASTSSGNQPVV